MVVIVNIRPHQVNILVSGPSQRKSKVGMRQKIKIKICVFSKLYLKFPKSFLTAALINEDGQNIKNLCKKVRISISMYALC